MNGVADSPGHVTGGVDTHADVHVAAAVCSTSHRLLGTVEFETTRSATGSCWLGC